MSGPVYHNTFSAMGTRFEIVLPGIAPEKGEALTSIIKDEINRIEEIINRYDRASEVSLINKTANKCPVSLGEELFLLIKECIEFSRQTYGAFDITLRALNDFWNNIDASPAASAADGVEDVLSSVGMDKIELNESERKIFLRGNASLDFGAAGKGYALKCISSFLDDYEIENGIVSFGESSVLLRGSHPNGDCWRIGIPDPNNPAANLFVKELKNCSVSTSGNTLNNSIPGRVNIINPFTGMPEREFKTIFAVHSNPLVAEVLSTALMVLDEEKIYSVLEKFPGAYAAKILYTAEKEEIIEFNNKHSESYGRN